MRILIRTPNWLGDSVMSIPTIIEVKRLFPNAEIWVWTKAWLMDLWRLVPEVDGVIDSVPKGHDFSLGILLTNSFSSALKMYLAGVSERRGYNINARRILLTQPVSLENRNIHQIEYFMGIIGRVKIESNPKIDIPLGLKDEAKELLACYGWDEVNNIIGIHATAGYGPAKCWMPERFTQLIDKLINLYNAWIVVIGRDKEKEDIWGILKNAPNHSKIINLAGKTDLRKLLGIISLCRVFVANDSGPMHLASSIGAPVVAIFGSTEPNRTGPRGKVIVIKKDIPCSPCFRRKCPKAMECMDLVSMQDVLDAVWKQLN